jgi:DNA-binding transcriptional ArsR family regulator
LDLDPRLVMRLDPRVVKALSHPTRVSVLRILDWREMASPSELSVELGVPLGTMGYHVRRLEALGVLELAATKQRRGAIEHFYRTADAVNVLSDRTDPSGIQAVVRTSVADREMAAVVEEVARATRNGGFDSARAQLVQRVVLLDAAGRRELAAAMAQLTERVEEIQAESAARMAERGGRGCRELGFVAMDFDVAAPAPSSRRATPRG